MNKKFYNAAVIAISAFFIISIPARAEIIFEIKKAYEANVKVFETAHKLDAHLAVYITKNKLDAKGNEAVWYFTGKKHETKIRMFFVKDKHSADIIVYFEKHKMDAGWKKDNKFRGKLK